VRLRPRGQGRGHYLEAEVGEVEAASSRERLWARSLRARPPRSVRSRSMRLVRARSVWSKVAWGLGMRIRSEGRVFRFESGGCFRI
jgi:hypothetical protein